MTKRSVGRTWSSTMARGSRTANGTGGAAALHCASQQVGPHGTLSDAPAYRTPQTTTPFAPPSVRGPCGMVCIHLRLRGHRGIRHRADDLVASGIDHRAANSSLHRIRSQGLPRCRSALTNSGLETDHRGDHPSYAFRVWAYSSRPKSMGRALHDSSMGAAARSKPHPAWAATRDSRQISVTAASSERAEHRFPGRLNSAKQE